LKNSEGGVTAKYANVHVFLPGDLVVVLNPYTVPAGVGMYASPSFCDASFNASGALHRVGSAKGGALGVVVGVLPDHNQVLLLLQTGAIGWILASRLSLAQRRTVS
jgi:hypothetical protein